jgi:hypothetical protein
MSSESSPEFFVDPARLDGTKGYTDVNGNAVTFPSGFVFGHEATHIIYGYTGSEESSVLEQFDNRFTDELGLPRRCPNYFGTCP